MASSASELPVVGVTMYSQRARFGVWDAEAAVLNRSYVNAVAAAGGAPALLPPVERGAPELVGRLDALVLSGGPDVDPVRYGAAAHPATGPASDVRDGFELAALAAAMSAGIPVLGVCRGMQVLNVARGGTLCQHLGDVVTDPRVHGPKPGTFGDHRVTVAADTRLAAILGPAATVRCHHHQAVADVGEGLVVTAHAADGTVEAVELPGEPFVLGVQWHPEADGRDHRLFAALVAAARH